jgi:hypothetical protein
MWSGASPFLVLAEMGAPLWSIMSTTFSCPDLAAQCSGVRPSLKVKISVLFYVNKKDLETLGKQQCKLALKRNPPN